MEKMPGGTADRPRVRPEASPLEWALEAAALAGLALLAGTLSYYWGRLPESVPVHFDFAGRADAWGGREAIVLVPVVAGFLFALLTLLTRLPHLYNYPWPITEANAPRQYALARTLMRAMKALVTWLFAFLTLHQCRTALGEPSPAAPWFAPAALGFVAVILVTYFVSARRAR